MIQEQKELLLKDLCARLPYGVVCADVYTDEKFINKWNILAIDGTYGNEFVQVCISNCEKIYGYKTSITNIKPYLFPLSSMTEEQWNNAPRVDLTNFTFESFKCGCFTLASYTCENNLHDLLEFINWLYKNHFDVNGLIPLGLAKDATNLNIY